MSFCFRIKKYRQHLTVTVVICITMKLIRLKGPMPSVLAFLFTMQIKCPCSLELIFIVKLQGLRVLAEIWQSIYILNILNTLPGYIFIARQNFDLEFLTGKDNMLCTSKFLQGIFSSMNEKDTSSLDCKHKYMLQKTELHLTILVYCNICRIQNSMALAAG